jgi:hypothetical protein
MKQLKRIIARNLRTFDELNFELPTEPGLYLITGENRDRPELGSNGVGKSSLWDVVSFAAYGASCRGLKGGDLIGPDERRALTAEIETDTGYYSRVWSRSAKLVIAANGQQVSQDELTTHLGLSHEMFLASVVIPQVESLFADLKPVDQIRTLQSLLSMERWLDYSKRASIRSAEYNTNLTRSGDTLARLVGERDGINLDTLIAAHASWETDRQLSLDACLSDKARAEVERAKAQADVDALPPKSDEPDPAIRRAENNLRILTAKQTECRRSEMTATQTAAAASANRQSAQTQLDSLLEERRFYEKEGQCPRCKQVIDGGFKDNCLRTMDAATEAFTQSIQEHRLVCERSYKEAAEHTDKLVEIHKQISTANATLANARAALNTAISVASEKRNKLARAVGDLASITRRETEIRTRVNPTGDAVTAAVARLAKLDEDIAIERDSYESWERQAQMAAVWAKGFKAIRSQLVSSALNQFALDIAAVCEDLGLKAWSVVPEIDPTVFESARASTGFSFGVTDPDGVKRPLAAYSGGELQRVRLAIQLGLGSLIGTLSGSTWNFEVWDEPSTYMSEEGIVGLFRSLKERAQRTGKVIFVIDHHQVHYGELDAVYSLVREGNKTRLAL